MISFIMPSYNQGQFIKYAMDSVMANMGLSDQLIIADGASKDCTRDVVASYLDDPRIEWLSSPDRGFSEAVQKAFQRVRNPIVGIMSSDDAYVPGIRNRVLGCFDDRDVVLVYGDYELINIDNRQIGERRHFQGTLSDVLSLRVLLPQSSVFFRMSALDGCKILDLGHDYIADVVLFNQACLNGKTWYVPEIWSQVRKHEGSRTGKRNPGAQYLNAIETALAEIPVELKDKARAGAFLLRARYEASSMQSLGAVRSLMAGFALDPWLFNHWLFPRALVHILLGPNIVGKLSKIRHYIIGS